MNDNVVILAAEEPLPILPETGELIVGIIAFAILLFVLWKFFVPQFEALYKQRTEAIEGGLKRAEETQQAADKVKAEYEEQLAGLRAEAARIRDDARAEGQQIKTELRAEAEAEAARIREQAEAARVASYEATKRQLQAEIGGLSVQLAERLIGESLADDTRRSATVDSFLADLESSTGPSAQPTGAG